MSSVAGAHLWDLIERTCRQEYAPDFNITPTRRRTTWRTRAWMVFVVAAWLASAVAAWLGCKAPRT